MFPTLEQCKKLSSRYNRIPVYKRLNISHPGLLLLLKSLSVNGNIVFLESATQRKKQSRFSFLGFNPRITLIFSPPLLYIKSESTTQSLHCNDPFSYIREYVSRYSSPSFPQFGNYNGGLTGYFAYDMVNYTGHLRSNVTEDTVHPLMILYHIDDFICYDNKYNTYYLATCIYPDHSPLEETYRNACDKLDELEHSIITTIASTPLPYIPAYAHPTHIDFVTKENQFKQKVLHAKHLIEDGEALQVVLSIRGLINDSIDPYNFYLTLRSINPSPYMFYFRCGSLYLVGSSPEIHVRVVNNIATLRPIAGTIAQSKHKKQNIEQKQRLLANPKERAEHLMLVDLARNDLSIIADGGSVTVTQFMQPEDYSHVIHLVSQVEAKLHSSMHLVDVLRHTFPAGTVTGAPKVRAIEIIDELEDHPRGIYAGCVGYVGFNGIMDTCITIRSAVFSPECSYIQAGAGIVYDSIPQLEYNEIINKLKALSVSLPFAKTSHYAKEIV